MPINKTAVLERAKQVVTNFGFTFAGDTVNGGNFSGYGVTGGFYPNGDQLLQIDITNKPVVFSWNTVNNALALVLQRI